MAEYIKRSEALDKCGWYNTVNGKSICAVRKDELAAIPAADVEPVTHGRWLPQILLGERVWDCSECKTLGSPHWKRCPVCEAKMEVDNG